LAIITNGTLGIKQLAQINGKRNYFSGFPEMLRKKKSLRQSRRLLGNSS
jgi:hypothetical protein